MPDYLQRTMLVRFLAEMHDCGGTILTAGSGALLHTYCHRCGAFRYGEDVASLPTGTNPIANRAAWDAGEDASPEATPAGAQS